MDSNNKLTVEVPYRFFKFIRYRFGNTPRIILEPVGKKKKPSLEKDVSYWVPEKYRIVQNDNTKTIQYYTDFYKARDPKWIEASKMKKAYARYAFECVAINTKKLKTIGKKEAINTGIFNESIPQKIDSKMPDDFKKKSLEIWRFAHEWNSSCKEGQKWIDNPEVYMYSVVIHRLEPKYEDYRLRNWARMINSINKPI